VKLNVRRELHFHFCIPDSELQARAELEEVALRAIAIFQLVHRARVEVEITFPYLRRVGKVLQTILSFDVPKSLICLQCVACRMSLVSKVRTDTIFFHFSISVHRESKVLQTEVRSKKAELRNSGSMQRVTHGGDEFFVVERLHEKRDRPDGQIRGARPNRGQRGHEELFALTVE
jgi:hypothetical protein